MADLFAERQKDDRPQVLDTYDYVSEGGILLYQVVRMVPKSFRQRRPDGCGGWTWKLGDTSRVPYRLVELLAGVETGRWVVVVEGEKDVDRLRSLGFVATCNSGGAGKWRPEFAGYFAGAKVCIVPDNDDAGRAHAEQVAQNLHPVASDLRVLDLPGLPEKGDVSEWLNAGGTVEGLRRLILATQAWEPNVDDADAGHAAPDGRSTQAVTGDLSDLGVVVLADVKPEHVEWLWPGRIPKGKLTVLEGDPKVGKSTLMLDIAARVTTGTPFSDGHAPEVGTVLILTAEDGLADTVRPRLDAAGADSLRVIAWETVPDFDAEGNPAGVRSPSIPRDLDTLEGLIVRREIALVVVDVLNAYLGPDVNGHRDQDVRRALMPLAKLAERTGAAIVVLRHLNKSPGGSPLYRGGGSIGIAGAARSILLAAIDPDDESGERRVLVSQGSNLATAPEALAYQLEAAPEHDCACVRWTGASVHTSATLLADANDEERGALAEAGDVLRDILSEGPVGAKDVERRAGEAGVQQRTLRRAKERLGVRSMKSGRGQWEWALPALREGAQGAAEGAQGAELGHLGHLRDDQGIYGPQDGQSVEGGHGLGFGHLPTSDPVRPPSCEDLARGDALPEPETPTTAEDGEPPPPRTLDLYRCAACGRAVTPAPGSVERGRRTVCATCAETQPGDRS